MEEIKNLTFKALDNFFNSYLVERDFEKTLSLVTDDVFISNIRSYRCALNKADYREVLKKEYIEVPIPGKFAIRDFHYKKVCERSYECFCKVEFSFTVPRGEVLDFNTNVLASFVNIDETLLLSSLTITEPVAEKSIKFNTDLHFVSLKDTTLSPETYENLFRMLNNSIPVGIAGIYKKNDLPFYVLNNRILEMLGATYDEFLEYTGGILKGVIHPDDYNQVVLNSTRNNIEPSEYRILKKDGTYMWVSVLSSIITTQDGSEASLGVIVDSRKAVERRLILEELASRDSLTNLLNRRSAQKQIVDLLSKEKENAFAILDIDNFKNVNDEYGHYVGDEILVELAKILSNAFKREGDVVSRHGGDEFLVFVSPFINRSAITKMFDDVTNKFKKVVNELAPNSNADISIGITYDSSGKTFEELYKLADNSLYDIKASKKLIR